MVLQLHLLRPQMALPINTHAKGLRRHSPLQQCQTYMPETVPVRRIGASAGIVLFLRNQFLHSS
jgi:mRNA degradation ribonuclease J1/J2